MGKYRTTHVRLKFEISCKCIELRLVLSCASKDLFGSSDSSLTSLVDGSMV